MRSVWLWGAALGAVATISLSAPSVAAEPVDLSAKRAGTWGYDSAGGDKTVRPGDDFFAFTNGVYLHDTPIPADRTWYGVVNVLRDLSEARVHDILDKAAATAPVAPAAADNQGKIGAYYKAFLDASEAEALDARPLAPQLAEIRAANDKTQIAALLGSGKRGFGATLFAADKFTDLKNPDRYAMYIDQGGLGMPDRDYYLETGFAAKKQAYEAYVATMLGMIGWPDAAAKARDIVGFETDIAKVSWTKAEGRDPDKSYNPMSPTELASYAPGFDWKTWLDAAGLGKRDRLIAASNTALPKIAAVFKTAPLDTLKAYLAFHLANNAAPYLSSRFVDASFAFNGKALSGQQALSDRWKRAVRSTDRALGEATGKIYVDRYFGADAKAQTADMVVNLKAAYKKRIENLSWMSPATKTKAVEKLAAMDVQIGYPKSWRDYSALSVKSDDLFGNVERSIAWRWDDDLSWLDRPVDRGRWDTTPQTVNAFNDGTANQLIFPAAFMQPPSFDPGADPAVNYGALGAVIGHEISHGFDDQGRKFDAKGRLTDWWTPDDNRKFLDSAKSFGAQYEAYPIFPDAKIKGDLTMGENIADLGGILAALDAYHASLGGKPAPVIDGLTGDQRFFLGYAQYYRNKMRDDFLRQLLVSDPHSPVEARVNVILPNVDQWYKAWGIKPGDRLYLAPEKRIRVW